MLSDLSDLPLLEERVGTARETSEPNRFHPNSRNLLDFRQISLWRVIYLRYVT
jgi:hypothetical protein